MNIINVEHFTPMVLLSLPALHFMFVFRIFDISLFDLQPSDFVQTLMTHMCTGLCMGFETRPSKMVGGCGILIYRLSRLLLMLIHSGATATRLIDA